MQNIAAIFPGQGSQSVGMLKSYLATYPQVSALCAKASEVLGYDIQALIEHGPKSQLNQTQYTQPALLVVGYALWQVWQSHPHSKIPQLLAGHSLGEYTALTCAGVFQFEDVLPLVQARAEYMQQACPEGIGAMAAILGCDETEVKHICVQAAAGEVVSPVNFNAPGQIVIAGHKTAVMRAIDIIKTEYPGKRVVLLPVSVPSHCALMKPASEKLAVKLTSTPMQSPNIPVLHNVMTESLIHPDDIRNILVEQLYSPVRWKETMVRLIQEDTNIVVECGPGKVLSGLMKRVDRNVNIISLFEPTGLTELLEMKD